MTEGSSRPKTFFGSESMMAPALFPIFSSVADDNQTYDNARMAGGAYIVVFSAEWCNSPCYTTMHAIWNAKAELPVLVMSTDPAENAGGLTLSEWHDSANAHDDQDEDGAEVGTGRRENHLADGRRAREEGGLGLGEQIKKC